MKTIQKYSNYFNKRTKKNGASYYILCGGRRSGKTFAICQRLLALCWNDKRIVNIASMTSEQGRLGAFADCKTIIDNAFENCDKFAQVLESPREIRFYNGSRISFNSYQNSERAKGIACDYLFLNEANNFSKQHYIDLTANVRRGVYLDFNPNIKFWVDDYFCEDDILRTTWVDNEYLSPMQLDYFAKLKELGDRPDASPIDRRNYLVYYLGQYAEIQGKIFLPSDFEHIEQLPTDLKNFCVFCDPSALRGADWFPIVVSAYSPTLDKVVFVEVDSTNIGARELQAKKIKTICGKYDGVRVYVETNGIIGAEFYEYCVNSDLPVSPWYSRGNKFERIVAQYEEIRNSLYFDKSEQFFEQVYDFDKKCDHDDNIDAIASSVMLQKFLK